MIVRIARVKVGNRQAPLMSETPPPTVGFLRLRARNRRYAGYHSGCTGFTALSGQSGQPLHDLPRSHDVVMTYQLPKFANTTPESARVNPLSRGHAMLRDSVRQAGVE